MNVAKARFKFILGRRKKYPLHLELEVYKGAKCRVLISTGIVLESEKQWDAARQIVIKNVNATQYNKFLGQMVQNVDDAEAEADRRGDELTPEAIKLAAKSQTAKGEDVFETFGRYINEDRSVKAATKKSQRGYVNALCRFVQFHKGSKNATLHFGEVSLNLIKAAEQYLFDRVKPGYISSFHYYMRKFLRKAKREGLIAGNPYDSFEVVYYSSGNRQALTSDQLVQIENVDRSHFATKHIKVFIVDMFLLSCYTGLRYSDIISLRRENVHRDAHGLVIQKKTIKTGIEVTLPLYSIFGGKPQSIVMRYLEADDNVDFIFPQLSKSVCDRSLHRLERLLSLPFPLTFHVARHTCASQLAERVDNPFVIMSVLGHGEIDTSMHYIHTSHKTAEKKLENVKWEDDMTPEEIAQADSDIDKTCEEIRRACERKGVSSQLTRLALGIGACNADNGLLIAEWIGRIRKTDHTAGRGRRGWR